MTPDPIPWPDPMPRSLVVGAYCGRKTRAGFKCTQFAMRGQTVCRMHGGKAPQAMSKAEERLRALEHPAITALGLLIQSGDFQAVRWLLEVLGHKATVQVQAETEVTVRVIHEDQPIVVVEQGYRLNGDGRADDQTG